MKRCGLMGLLAVAASVGCTSQTVEETAVLVMDLEARDAGWQVEIYGDDATSTLPVLLDATDEVVLVNGDEVVEFEPEHGFVLSVIGEDAELVWYEMAWDVDPNSISVIAPEDAAYELAESIGAEVEDGESGFIVVGENAFLLSAEVAEPAGILESSRLPPPEDEVAVVSIMDYFPATAGKRSTVRVDVDGRFPFPTIDTDARSDLLANESAAAGFWVGRYAHESGGESVTLSADGSYQRRSGCVIKSGKWAVGLDGVRLLGTGVEEWSLAPGGFDSSKGRYVRKGGAQ